MLPVVIAGTIELSRMPKAIRKEPPSALDIAGIRDFHVGENNDALTGYKLCCLAMYRQFGGSSGHGTTRYNCDKMLVIAVRYRYLIHAR